MKLIKISLAAFTLLLLSTLNTIAVPAYPYPVKIKQADGSELTVVLKGDEFHHYYETEDGYLLIKNKNDVFHYAQLQTNGIIKDTGVKASEKNKRTKLEKELIKTLDSNISFEAKNNQMRVKRKASSNESTKQNSYPLSGSPKALVILVNFQDVGFQIENPNEAFTNLLNEEGYNKNGGTGSARDYFRDASMGIFNPEFDVYGPYTLPNDMEFYGGNDSSGGDKNPTQMIIDACIAAHNDGVDFTTYDTDNDKVLDNVFVYYAGYNEAENGGANTIWPHRWGVFPGFNYEGSVASITFDGVRVLDYACSSELKGRTGVNMAGIGTFTHEFSHVLGLPDLYATDGSTHHTLSEWSIMDLGTYLNGGNTPPTYSAYERFLLGYINPILLDSPISVTLNPLNTHNEAFILTESETHNLNGRNPNPKEYFLLENRQNTAWDSYLPGHGMLIYRIFHNPTDIYNNQINNDKNKMGVDIIEADGVASRNTLAGDPFPGSRNVRQYIPELRSGDLLEENKISLINENNLVISFDYRGGHNSPIFHANGINQSFSTILGTTSDLQEVVVSGSRLRGAIELTILPSEHFEMKLKDDENMQWSKSLDIQADNNAEVNDSKVLVRYNPTQASLFGTHEAEITLKSKDADERKISLLGTSSYPYTNELLIKKFDNFIRVYPPKQTMDLYIYDIHGRLVQSISIKNRKPIEIYGLKKNNIYLFKADNYFNKIIL